MIISKSRFDTLVSAEYARILKKLPSDISEHARQIAFLSEDLPGKGGNDTDLLGEYDGVPLNERTVYDAPMPGRIVIYRIPLMESCRNIKELTAEIRITILHEIGHHLGFNEKELADRGLD